MPLGRAANGPALRANRIVATATGNSEPTTGEIGIQRPPTTVTTIRTLIVDDHPVVRYGIKHMLDAEPDIEVVGELEHLNGVGPLLDELAPDVVLLDLELEETHGVYALRRIHEVAPELRVIIYTAHDDEDRIVQAAELGVDGREHRVEVRV